MAKTLSIITNGSNGGLPVQNQGLKLSKIIAIEKIEEHERFKSLYTIDEDVLERIADDMKAHKFDASQPVHIWLVTDDDGTEHLYLIDGYTRVRAAKEAGLSTVPYFEHHFESFEEAHRYALHLQVDRRNLEDADFLRNVELLMGSDYIQNFAGNKNAAIGRLLGKSEKTIERANFVEKHASEEQKAEIESGEATINATYNDIKRQQFIEKHATDEQKQMLENGEISEDTLYSALKLEESREKARQRQNTDDGEEGRTDADALDDTSGEPHGIVIGDHSDHIERPTNRLDAATDSERTRERRNAYELGFVDGFIAAINYAVGKILKGENASDAAYIYDYVFSREKPTFAYLSALSSDSFEEMRLNEMICFYEKGESGILFRREQEVGGRFSARQRCERHRERD